MKISREVAANEVYLDQQIRCAEVTFPVAPARVWIEEIAKAFVWIVGVSVMVYVMALIGGN